MQTGTQKGNVLRTSALIALLTVFFLAGTAHAQQEYQNQPPTDVSKKEINNYAQAYTEVLKIQERYSQVVQGVKDESEIKELQQKFTQKMIDQVKKNGLTVDRYTQISQAMQHDQNLYTKVEEKIQSLR